MKIFFHVILILEKSIEIRNSRMSDKPDYFIYL